jgi:hypothetical protein
VITPTRGVPPFDPAAVLGAMNANRLTIDKEALVKLVEDMQEADVGYKLGAKARFKTPLAAIDDIDCSGFVRYAIYHATDGQVQMPDGSWNQDDWCKGQKFQVVDYRSTAGTEDGLVRVAFLHTPPVGHVWLVLDGETIESHGGAGPDRRDWHTKILYGHVSKCYVLG